MMFTAIKDGKIIAYNDSGDFPCLVYDEVREVADEELVMVDSEFVSKDDERATRLLKDEQIAELKQKLADTDYIDNKLVEAMLRDDGSFEVLKQKYASTIANRQVWRTTIDELEG